MGIYDFSNVAAIHELPLHTFIKCRYLSGRFFQKIKRNSIFDGAGFYPGRIKIIKRSCIDA